MTNAHRWQVAQRLERMLTMSTNPTSFRTYQTMYAAMRNRCFDIWNGREVEVK